MRRVLSFIALWMVLATSLLAQEKEYLYEIGGGIGSSWSYGDVNKSGAVYSPSVSFNVLYRYNLNLRWALAAELQSNGLSGDTRDFYYATPNNEPHSFNHRCWQLAVRPEIHFWNYGLGDDYREKRRYTPFLTAGLSAGIVDGANGSEFLWGIPLGIGYKLKIAKRWNAQLTGLFTKTFSDQLDAWQDPEGIQTTSLVGNDWMASITLSVTFDFKERCIECHNQKNQAR